MPADDLPQKPPEATRKGTDRANNNCVSVILQD
jgi:hypothetical protein